MRADRREDAEVDDSGKPAENPHDHAECAAVADFEELRKRQHLGLAVAVVDEAGEAQDGHGQRDDLAPPRHRPAGVAEILHGDRQRDEAHPGHAVGRGEQITPARAPRREEIGHAADVLLRVEAENGDYGNRNREKEPVDRLHVQSLCLELIPE